MSDKFVVVDLETTGNSPNKKDRIIQFAAVVVENGEIVEQFSSLLNPRIEIPVFIEELTGINDKMVEDAPEFTEIAPKIVEMLDDAYFVAHNVLFDLSFLQEELLQAGFEGFLGPVLDTVEMARFLFPTADSYKLNDLALKLGLEHDRPHQADSDAYVTAELFILLLTRLNELPNITLQQLLKLSGGLKSDVALLLDDIVVENEQRYEEVSPSLDIHKGIAIRMVNDIEEKFPNVDLEYPKSHDAKEKLFRHAFPNYENRTGQFDMMDTVLAAFSQRKHALIEAGTGVGKSIAYLLPAAILAHQKQEPIVISTYTTQLQEQLLTKDIPILKSMLPFDLKTTLLKGRTHYINLAKFEQSLRVENENYDISLTKMQILIWLLETETGDRDELNLSSGGSLFWGKINDDEGVYFQDKSWLPFDFYLRARKKAQYADLIITNHSFLLTDLISERSILPSYRYCVLDEGHHFVKAAGRFFGDSLDYLGARLLLSRLGQYEQKQSYYYLDRLIQKKAPNEGLPPSFEVNELINEALLEMDSFFQMAACFALKSGNNQKQSSRTTKRIAENEQLREWKALITSGERFYFALKDLGRFLEKSLEVLSNIASFTKEEKLLLDEITSIQIEISQLYETIRKVILKPTNDFVGWIDTDGRAVQNSTTIYTHPVSVANYLQEQFFSQKRSVVITSASLSVHDSFDYIVKELGLTEFPYLINKIESPFRYDEQLQLIVTNDLPEINSVPMEEYVSAITEHIISIAEATKGRMLILFTSHDMLRKTYHLIKDSGLLDDYVLLGQGITGGSRSRLTRHFQHHEKAILLGTSSFWEGIDIPGSDLSCLVIVRLPFSPPNEPVTEAKCQFIEKNGGNPFTEYSLPEAIIRFKQGFGRLIRSNQDRGVMVIFDQRLFSTKYGRAFLKSIPSVPVERRNITEIVEIIEEWL